MPIKTLQTNRQAQFPVIGKLRKGGAKPEKGNAPGKDLDHFRFVTDDRNAAEAFLAYYGPEPTEISVFLPFATAAENFDAWMEEYTAGAMLRRCDGETMVFHRDDKNNPVLAPEPCRKACGLACLCKQVGRLKVIIPQLARLAWVMVETHSVYDIIGLTENLQAIEALRGDLRGIPMILSRRPREISTPGQDGKRVRRTKSLLFIEPDPSWVARQLESMRLAALPIIDVDVDAGGRYLEVDEDAEIDDWDEPEHEHEPGQTVQAQKPAQQPQRAPQPTQAPRQAPTTATTKPAAQTQHKNGNGNRQPAQGSLLDGTIRGSALVEEWAQKGGEAAYVWAVDQGAFDDTATAKATLVWIVNQYFGGELKKSNAKAVFSKFLLVCQERIAAQVDGDMAKEAAAEDYDHPFESEKEAAS